jgi:hypothetical protein
MASLIAIKIDADLLDYKRKVGKLKSFSQMLILPLIYNATGATDLHAYRIITIIHRKKTPL